MCGRYTYYSSAEIVKEYELLPQPKLQQALDFEDDYNVLPGSRMPVIVRGEQEHEVDFMIWGLVPAWSKPGDRQLKLINARKEGLLDKKKMWKRIVIDRRCIVPAQGFYEWKKMVKGKQPYYITLKNDDIMSFAGLWDESTDEHGKKVKTYSIITTTPNKEMSGIHNRMPVILNRQQMEAWLSPVVVTQEFLDDLLRPLPDGSLKSVKVSTKVNDGHNHGEELIYSLPEA